MALSNYEEQIRVQRDLATVQAFKELSKKNIKKAKSGSKKLSGDFTTEKPNVIKVLKKYNNKGTVLLGYSLDNKAWRFGHDLSKIHAKTVITVEDGAIYELPTADIYAYIHEIKPIWISSKYGIFNSRAYQTEIHPLVEYCGQKVGYSV